MANPEVDINRGIESGGKHSEMSTSSFQRGSPGVGWVLLPEQRQGTLPGVAAPRANVSVLVHHSR